MSELTHDDALNKIDMTKGSPYKNIIKFSLPLLLGNVFQQLYNMVDMIVVGKFAGEGVTVPAMAAVNVAFPIFFMLSSLFIGLGIGATVMISQYFGGKDYKKVAGTVQTMYRSLLVLAIPIGVIGVVISKPMLLLVKCPDDTMPYALSYLMTIMGGIIFSFGYNINAGILQGLGDSKSPLLFLTIATVINIILDLVFVIVFKWATFGVALATVIAQACSWLFGVYHINKKYPFLKINLLKTQFDKDLFKQSVKLGLPSGIQQMLFSFGVLAIAGLVNSYGDNFSAGFGAANKVDSFAFMPIQSFSSAATTFVGQNIGANRMDRVRKGIRASLILSIVVSLIIAAGIYPFSRQIMTLFNDDPEVISAGVAYLQRILPFFWMLSILFILNGVIRGAGEPIIPMLSSILSLWLVRVPSAYLLDKYFGKENIFFCFGIGWVLGIIITVGYYVTGKWKNKSLTQPKPETELAAESLEESV